MPKLTNRQEVEGTTPTIYIGHRLDRAQDGSMKASKKWWAEYCVDAKQRYESLRTTNKKIAIQGAFSIVKRLETDEPAVSRQKIGLGDLAKRYMDLQRNKERAPKTIQKYQYILDQLTQFASDHRLANANAFGPDQFWSFNRYMTDQELSDRTRYGRLLIVKQFFKWAAKSKLLPRNAIEGETVPEPQAKRQPFFTPEQVAILFHKADPHEAAIYTMFAYTGLRFGEVQQLRWCDLTLPPDGDGTIDVQRGGSRPDTTKGKQSRRVPIHPKLREVIDKLPRDFETVFTARPSRKYPDGGNMISERRLLLSLKRLCKRCSFEKPDQYQLHSFRRTFASMLAMNGVPIAYSLDLMGHADSEVLDLYVQLFAPKTKSFIDAIIFPTIGASDATAA